MKAMTTFWLWHRPDRRSIGEPTNMIRISVCQDDGCWLYRLDPTTPIGTAINENVGICPPRKQRAVEPMPTLPFPNIAAGAEEVEVHATNASPKLCQPRMIWINAPGAHSWSALISKWNGGLRWWT